jgi:hypothetical protein
MRASMPAQSCASVPPEPDWMSMKQLAASIWPLNMRRNSRSPTRFSSSATSAFDCFQGVFVVFRGPVRTVRWYRPSRC